MPSASPKRRRATITMNTPKPIRTTLSGSQSLMRTPRGAPITEPIMSGGRLSRSCTSQACRHVTGRPDEAGEHHDGEARGDGPLGRKPHAKYHQRDHHHPATDPDEPRERSYKDASQEDQGEGYILTVTIVVAPATGGRVGEGYE